MEIARIAQSADGSGLEVRYGSDAASALSVTALVRVVDDGASKARVVRLGGSGSMDDASGTLTLAHEGVSLAFLADGALQATAPEGGAVQRVDLEFRGSGFPRVFTQGFQSWSLSSAHRTGVDVRQKSVVSKIGLSGMFQDTDGAGWKEGKKGLETHGVLVLQGADPSVNLLLGASSCKQAVTSFWVRGSGSGRNVSATCYVDFGKPGKAGTAEEMLSLGFGASAAELLEAFGASVRAEQDDNSGDAGLALESPLRQLGRAPVGWGSWYEFYEKVRSSDVTAVLEAIVKDDAVRRSIDVFQLDDGFQLNTGDWLATRPRFGESELSRVAERIATAGFTPGLWVAPFLASKTSLVFKQHPEWFLRKLSDPKGFVRGHINPAWKRSGLSSMIMYVLDLSNPEVLAHLESVFRELAKHWKLFKVDFLAAGMREGVRLNGAAQTRVESYIAGVRAMRRGIGPGSFLLGCGAPIMASAQTGCFDAMRVSCDTAEMWLPPRLLRAVAFDWSPPACKPALWGNMTRWFQHGNFWKFNDPDCLVLRRKGSSMTDAQVRSQVSILGLIGGLMLFTDNMSTLEQDRKELALAVLPATPLSGRPHGDVMEPNAPPRTFAVGDLDDEAAAAAGASVNWTERNFTVAAPRAAFDFWAHRRLNAGDTVRIAPGDVLAAQFVPKGQTLVGTSLHLTALADGRVRQAADGVVSGTDELALREGLLAFDAAPADFSVGEVAGVEVVGEPFALPDDKQHTVGVRVRITAPVWSLAPVFA